MQNLKSKLNGFVTGLLFAISLTVLAAGVTDLSAVKGTLAISHGGLGNTTGTASAVPATGITGLGSGVPLTTTVNTANGMVKLNGSGQLPAIDISLGTGITGSQVQAAGVLAITCTTPAANDTYVYNGTGLTCVHHATSLDYTTAHTVNASDVNAASPCTVTSASAVVITFDLDANVPTVEGDSVCFAQASTGAATASGVSSSVTVSAEGDKKSTNGLNAGWCAVKTATANLWRLFGNRI